MLTPRENFLRFFRGEACEWTPNSGDVLRFCPRMIPDNVARGFVEQLSAMPEEEYGGRDFFGVDWYYDRPNRGSMELAPLFDELDALEDWEEILVFPDLDELDWEGCAEENRDYLDTDKILSTTIYSGFFERLISFVGFENAAIAVVDGDYKEPVKALFDRLADLYIDLIKRMHRHFNVEWVELHDDWGTQISTIFSTETYKEMILPYITKVVSGAHSQGVFYEQHSCGLIENLVPYMISSGADTWRGQDINDKKKLVETYGHRFKFGVEVKPAAPESDGQVISLVEKCLADYEGCDIWIAFGKNLTPEQKLLSADFIRGQKIKIH